MSPAEIAARAIRARIQRVGHADQAAAVRLTQTLMGYGKPEIEMFARDVAKAIGDREARFADLPTPARGGETIAFDGVIVRAMQNSNGQTELAVGFTVR